MVGIDSSTGIGGTFEIINVTVTRSRSSIWDLKNDLGSLEITGAKPISISDRPDLMRLDQIVFAGYTVREIKAQLIFADGKTADLSSNVTINLGVGNGIQISVATGGIIDVPPLVEPNASGGGSFSLAFRMIRPIDAIGSGTTFLMAKASNYTLPSDTWTQVGPKVLLNVAGVQIKVNNMTSFAFSGGNARLVDAVSGVTLDFPLSVGFGGGSADLAILPGVYNLQLKIPGGGYPTYPNADVYLIGTTPPPEIQLPATEPIPQPIPAPVEQPITILPIEPAPVPTEPAPLPTTPTTRPDQLSQMVLPLAGLGIAGLAAYFLLRKKK